MADTEGAVLEDESRAVMAELVATTGRPMVHDLRAVLDAIGYVTRYGADGGYAGRLATWAGQVLDLVVTIVKRSDYVQLSPWSHQGHINTIGPALYGPMPAST